MEHAESHGRNTATMTLKCLLYVLRLLSLAELLAAVNAEKDYKFASSEEDNESGLVALQENDVLQLCRNCYFR